MCRVCFLFFYMATHPITGNRLKIIKPPPDGNYGSAAHCAGFE